jgi:hypothetical protein
MLNCPECGTAMIGVEYRLTREDYDGVSEWLCEGHTPPIRIGRWSGRRLNAGEIEGRYGRGTPVLGELQKG